MGEQPFAGRHVCLVAAHPDDETIGFAAQMGSCARVSIVHVTDGAPRSLADAHRAGFAGWQDYAEARQRELAAALALTHATVDTVALGFADQQASAALVEGAVQLAALLADLAPDAIVTHPYEGGHPDHDATAFMVHAVSRRLQRAAVPLWEMTSYHRRHGAFVAGRFLEPVGPGEVACALDPPARELKRRMFDCFATQAEVLGLFGLEEERFRPAPDYDFTRSPTEEMLHYEQFDWGMTGLRFRGLAAQALARLAPSC